jgi:hypothetical protein
MENRSGFGGVKQLDGMIDGLGDNVCPIPTKLDIRLTYVDGHLLDKYANYIYPRMAPTVCIDVLMMKSHLLTLTVAFWQYLRVAVSRMDDCAGL